jgi:hypothetical protein
MSVAEQTFRILVAGGSSISRSRSRLGTLSRHLVQSGSTLLGHSSGVTHFLGAPQPEICVEHPKFTATDTHNSPHDMDIQVPLRLERPSTFFVIPITFDEFEMPEICGFVSSNDDKVQLQLKTRD